MNPLAVARLGANVSIVLVMLAFVVAVVVQAGQVSSHWSWIIGGVAGIAVLIQVLAGAIWPKAVPAAWDEQVLAQQSAANTFAYFATLAAFLVFLCLAIGDWMRADLAFYLMGVPLGVAPALWMIIAHLRGRAG